MQQIEPDVAENPFSLSNIHGMKSTGQDQSMTNLGNNDEELLNAREVDKKTKKENSYSSDDDTSSVSSVSDTD